MRKKIFFTIITVILFLGLMCGCHKSANDITPVTRGEWLSMLAEGFGLEAASSSSTPYFEDIPVGHELYDIVQSLSNWNILAPYTENKLDAGKTATRQEVAATAAIAAGYRAEGGFEIEQAAQFAAQHSILDITAQGGLTREECQTALEAAQRVYLESPGKEEITVVFNEELVNLTALPPGTIQAQGNTVHIPSSISSSVYQDDTGKSCVMLTTPSGEISLGEGMTFIISSTQRNLQEIAYKVVSLADGENGTVIIKTETPTLGDLYDELVVHTTVSLGPGNIFWEEGINAISVEGANHLSTGAEEYYLVLLGGYVEQGTYQECEHTNHFQNTWRIGPFGSNTVKGAIGISDYIKNGPAADALCNSGYSYIDIPGVHDFNGDTESWEKALAKRKSFEAGFQISGTISLDIAATTDVEYHKLDIFNHEIHLWPESASLSINSNIASDLKIEGILEGKYKLGEIFIPIGTSGLSVSGALFLHVTANGTAELTAEFSNWQKAEWNSKAEEYRQDNAKQSSLNIGIEDFALDLTFGAGVSADLCAASIRLIGTEVTIDGEVVSTGLVVGNCEEETTDGVVTRNYTEVLRFGVDLYAPIVSLSVSGPEHLSDILGLEHTWDLIGRDNTRRRHLWDSDFAFWEQTVPLDEKGNLVLPPNTYTTKWGTQYHYGTPIFSFDYPENWKIEESVSPGAENVTFTNERGKVITFDFYIPSYRLGTGISLYTSVESEIDRMADSAFVPGIVDGYDYSDIGPFIVAKVVEMRERHDLGPEGYEYYEYSGSPYYTVVPASYEGLSWYGAFENNRFNYGPGVVCLYASGADLTSQEEQEIIDILSSFRIGEMEPVAFDFSEFVGTYTPLPGYGYYGEVPPDITLDENGIIIGATDKRGTDTFAGTAPISVGDYGEIHCLLWESPPNEIDGAFSESYTIYPIGVPISNPYGNPNIQDDPSKVRIYYEYAKGGVWDMYYIKK